MDGVRRIEPLGCLDTIAALCQARIATPESWGAIEDAATTGVSTLSVRRTRELPQTLEAGVVLLTTLHKSAIFQDAINLLTNDGEHHRTAEKTDVFGDGHPAERIVAVLLQQVTPTK